MSKRTVSYKGYADANRRFDVEPSPGRERNKFGYVAKRHCTFDAGDLVPFMHFPVLPGDDLNFNPLFLIRMSNPFVSPVMDEIYINYYFFLTYNRFVFDDWNAFMGEVIQQNPDYDESGDNIGGESLTTPPYNSSGQYELPTMWIKPQSNGDPAFAIGSLYDNFALPYNVGNNGYEIQTLPLRHYNLIYNEYFRDENLQSFAPVPKSIGPDKIGQYKMMQVSKYADYFTGSLPFLQKGPEVAIGLTGDIPVTTMNPLTSVSSVPLEMRATGTGNIDSNIHYYGSNAGDSYVRGFQTATSPATGPTFYPANLWANLGLANSVALAQLRLAFQLQRFYEGQARSGTRYIEYVHFMFNEYIPDAQLLRPKFIGGGKIMINVNPVTQTSNTTDAPSTLGTLAAFGVAFHDSKKRISCHVQEHGYVIGVMCARTNLSYQQGLRRDWSYRDRLDFYTPTLAHLAEQDIKNKELCCTGITEYDDGVFGYIGRYDEYRTTFSEVTGAFRDNAPLSLKTYQLGEFFDVSNPGTASQGFPGLPHLNANFIKQPKNVVDKVLNIPSTAPEVPQFLCDYACQIYGSRVVSKYGIPGFADHF